MGEFSAKERLRFRKLLEVAHSSTFAGERDAALAAAARLAASHGMSLREAAGMAEADDAAPPPRAHRRAAGFPSDFGAAMRASGLHRDPRNSRTYSRFGGRGGWTAEDAQLDAEKRRFEAAMADAVNRGLDAAERAAAAKNRDFIRRPNKNAFRDRREFIRVLLGETQMTAREIAATAGVSIYDVFREKLLMRKKSAA